MEITEHNVGAYLAARGWPAGRVVSLGGGVSNVVLLVESGAQRIVVKQSLEKLRVQDDWCARRDRIWRERDCIQTLRGILPPACLPEVVFSDDDNFLFAMTAAPGDARPWKDHLLAGDVDPAIARRAGELLARMHSFSCNNTAIAGQYGDQTCFDQLRVDPYYRALMARHPDMADRIAALMAAMDSRRLALVHGDYSPKNMLVAGGVAGGEILLIDFEVVHYGDPGFDTGFLLNHLLLKSFHRPELRSRYLDAARVFWDAYNVGVPARIAEIIERATCEHLGALLLARVDGKSPAEYLSAETRGRVRQAARKILVESPRSLERLYEVAQ